jgi:hypothetical protein
VTADIFVVVLDLENLQRFARQLPHLQLGHSPTDAHPSAESERKHHGRTGFALQRMALDPAFRNELTGRREIFLLAAHHLNARHYYRLKTLEEPVSVRWIFL